MTVDERTTESSGDERRSEDTVRLDWRTFEGPSAGVVHAAARASGLAPTDLPPLQETIETDALSAVLDGRVETGPSPIRITFCYAGLQATISTDGDLIVSAGTR